MAGRSPVRFLAPLALVAFAVALFVIVTGTRDTESESGPNRSSEARPTATPQGARKGRRRYTVKPGDTPSSIAEKTGVPLADILRLNPDLDPQALSPGQRLKLRQ
jgi:LysM repeat protein